MYRCEATSVAGFVQQLAVSYVRHGYWFYVRGRIPADKDPRTVDQKLIEKYGIDMSKWTRCRRKRNGHASIQYLRHERFFLLLATHGHHRLFEEEARGIKDVRRSPIRFAGYSIGYRSGHARVGIEVDEYKRLKAYMLEIAVHRTSDFIADEFRRLPFESYRPVRQQLLNIWRAVNRRRKIAGFEVIPIEAIRIRRRVVRPFE